MNEVVIRRWDEIWHVQDESGSSTVGTFTDALLWATADLEEGGEGVIIRVGNPR